MQARGSTVVAAPAERAFDFVADPANDTRWRSYVLTSHGHADRVGDTISQTYSYQGRTQQVTMEVTEYERPGRLSFVIKQPVRIRMAFQFRPEAEGCRVSMSVSSMLPGAAAMFEGRIATELQRLITTDLQRLKDALAHAEEK